MEDIRVLYARFEPKHHRHLLPGLVECYRNVFADKPWDEWKRCTICNKKWGIGDQNELSAIGFVHCGKSVEDFWPTSQVESDILHEVTERTSCWLALTKEDGVIGFIWGYPITPQALAEKLGLQSIPDILKSHFETQEEVAYQDEVGVVSSFRNRKIASKLVSLRLKDFKNQGLRVGVVRTKRNPPSVTYLWYIRDGYEVIAEYGDEADRVILARGYEGYGEG